MALFFTCFAVFLLFHRIPIVGEFLLGVVVIAFVLFMLTVLNEYNKIQDKKAQQTELRR